MKVSEQMGANIGAEDLRQLIEEVGGKFDARLGKAAGAATAAILVAGANRKELRKAGKQLRRKVEDALRYVRKHPWETAALLAVTGAATMKAMEAHDGAPAEGEPQGPRPRSRRRSARRETRH